MLIVSVILFYASIFTQLSSHWMIYVLNAIYVYTYTYAYTLDFSIIE